ncbi:MAG TPA: hypothetical protein VMI30_01425 [Stellaceae bacterium]|nr:hypothetical protein [Stellaceae bacterium]
MAKTALSQLQDQIEAIRREAYEAGFAAAMQAVRDFTGRPTATPSRGPEPRPQAAAPAAEPIRRRGRRADTKAAPAVSRRSTTKRPQRGTNAQLIAEVLKAMPSRTARPAEIRKVLEGEKGIAMAFTSIRHALGQLAARNEVAALEDGKSWRYVGSSE